MPPLEQHVVSFTGIELSAVLVLASLCLADKKGAWWTNAMFAGVVGMAASGFGYYMPEIPKPDVMFIYSVLTMLAGVTISYYLHPAPPDQTAAERGIEQVRKSNGLWVIVVGTAITVIISTMVYLFTIRVSGDNPKGMLSILYSMQEVQKKQYDAQMTLQDQLDEISKKVAAAEQKIQDQRVFDSLQNLKLQRGLTRALINQQVGQKKQDKILAEIQNGPPIIVAPTSTPYRPSAATSPARTVQTLSVPLTRKQRRQLERSKKQQ